MLKRERMAWWIVCVVPQFIARWLMFNKRGQHFPLPKRWTPYLFGRALGVDGSKCTIMPTEVGALPIAKAEPKKLVA